MHGNTYCQAEPSSTVCPCTLLILGLPSNWRWAIMLLLCSSSSPEICPLKVLRIRFICPQFRSICVSNTFYSLKTPGIKFWSLSLSLHSLSDCATETAFLWTKRSTLAPDRTPAHKHFCPRVVMGDQTSEVGHSGLNPLLCLAQAHRQQFSSSTFPPFLLPLPSFPSPRTTSASSSVKEGVDLQLILQAPISEYFGAPPKAKWHLRAWRYRMRAQCFKASQKIYRTVNMI